MTGSLPPPGSTPSTSISPEPIIQSMWIRLRVGAAPRELRLAGRGAALQAGAIGLADRDVAGGVLVEQRVEEQQPAGGDRRGMRHQRHLAQAAGALVGVEHLRQHVLAGAGRRLDDAPGLEPHGDVADQRAAIGERLGAADVAVHACAVRGGEHLLAGDVGVAGDAVLRRLRPAHPEMAVRQADAQVGARAAEVQRVVALAVQLGGAGVQGGVVVGPGGDRVRRVDAGGGEDRVPQPGDRLRPPAGPGTSARPGGGRVADDAPVDGEVGDQLQRRAVGDGAGAVGRGRPGPGPGRPAAPGSRRRWPGGRRRCGRRRPCPRTARRARSRMRRPARGRSGRAWPRRRNSSVVTRLAPAL